MFSHKAPLWKQQGRSLLLREDPACKASVKVASFDLNDTLVSSRIGAPGYQVTVSDWQFYNASVPEKLRKLHSDGFRLVIFTNQGNIRSALEGKRATAFKGYVDAFAKELGAPILVLAATMKDQLRKPNGGMWEQLEKMNGAIDKDQSFFVGDAAGGVGEHSADDADFAKTVGVKFIHTNEFFGPPGGLEPSIEPPKKAARLEGLAQSVTLGGDEVSGDPLVLVLVGLPGSGKTTFAQKLAPSGGNSVRWQRTCQDLLRSKEACLRAASKALEEGFSVIIDRTDINVEQRAPWVQLASEKGVAAHALIFDVPAEECGRRASERRDHEGGLQGAGVRIVISKLQKMQQAVTAEEGFARVRLCRAPELQAELERYGEKALQAPKETEPGSSGAESDLARKVILLQSLGFPEASCRKALEASKGDPDAAANQLLAERLTDGATCCD